jgi:hypothetical protein
MLGMGDPRKYLKSPCVSFAVALLDFSLSATALSFFPRKNGVFLFSVRAHIHYQTLRQPQQLARMVSLPSKSDSAQIRATGPLRSAQT